MSQSSLAILAGSWLICKLRRQQAQSGTYRAARNAWRQGVPLEVALLALVGRTQR